MFACEIQSPPNDWIQNPSFIAKTEIQHLESEFHGVTFLDSKTVLHSLTWVETGAPGRNC